MCLTEKEASVLAQGLEFLYNALAEQNGVHDRQAKVTWAGRPLQEEKSDK